MAAKAVNLEVEDEKKEEEVPAKEAAPFPSCTTDVSSTDSNPLDNTSISPNEIEVTASDNNPKSSILSSSWWKRKQIPEASLLAEKDIRSSIENARKRLFQEAMEGSVNLLCRRPERICVLMHHDGTKDPLKGIELHSEDGIVSILKIHRDSSLNVRNPITVPYDAWEKADDDSYQEGSLLKEGDMLESINDWACSGKSIEEVSQYLDSLSEGNLYITFRTKDGKEHIGLFQLVILKSDAFTDSAQLVPSTAESPPKTDVSSSSDSGIPHAQWETKIPQEKEIDQNAGSGNPLGLQVVQRKTLLQIRKSESLLNPALRAGDFLVALGFVACAGLQPLDAETVWNHQVESWKDCLSLLVVEQNDTQRRWDQVRRTAVAVSGGALLGVGAVIMATPLHPVGHAMAFGGIGVLGTEFEAPKRMIQATRDKFRRKEKDTATET